MIAPSNPATQTGVQQVRLLCLTLRNFMGIRDLTVEPDGKDLSVYGDNGAGKTTLASALFYLLFGKDSHGR
jgi:recombinational DNA repair ATPase RecF